MSLILTVIIAVFIVSLIWKSTREKKKYNFPPGPPRLPFIGSYLHLLWIDWRRPHISLKKLKEHYKSPVIGFGMGGYNSIVACDYKSVKEVFNNPALQGRLDVYPLTLRTYGKKHGIFADDGDDWLHLRRTTLRTMRDFGFGRRSDSFEAVVGEEARTLVEKLNAIGGKTGVVLPDYLYPTLFNMILHLVHGTRVPPKDHEILVHMGKTALRIITSIDNTGRIIAIWPWVRRVFPVISGKKEIEECSTIFKVFIHESYKRHKADFDEEVLRDLIDVFLKTKELHPTWTDEQVLTVCEDLMFPNAAVAIVLSFTLALLAKNQPVLKRCQQEIDDVVGRGRLPTLDDRKHLHLVEASIRESMRVQALAPLGVAHRSTEDTTLCGYDVPANSLVITHLDIMHKDPDVWKDPEEFNPDRFLEPGAKDTTFPFGLGKRVCAGETFARQNLFVILATILQNFDLETVVPLDYERYRCGIVIAPNSDFSMRFTPRV